MLRISYALKKSKKRHSWLALCSMVVGVLVILSSAYYLYSTGRLPFWHKNTSTHITGSPYTKGEAVIPSGKTSGAGTSDTGRSTSDTNVSPNDTSPPITGTLLAPWGTFANVYKTRPGDEMESTCNTTPGATCQIVFTNGSITKSLDAETTDAGGAVYWAWTPAGVGLTPGTWHITAKAILGTQTKTTSNDPLTLEIQ